MTSRLEPGYVGATTCDLIPDWVDSGEVLEMVKACHEADPDDLTPQLALADLLCEKQDPRERWVRVGCSLWKDCWGLKGRKNWDFDKAKEALSKVTGTPNGWRMACLWGCLVAWHTPSGIKDKPIGRTWVDERVKVVNRCVWWWSLGFLGKPGKPWNQASAAWHQAYAAGNQANAAWHQAYAVWYQANAAGNQAYAAWYQANAAENQANAAGNQANAVWYQAGAARYQAEAAEYQARVWRFARASWELCVSKLE